MPSLSDSNELLDTLILRSLADLELDLRCAPWFGRENELVNLFVFSHLLRLGSMSPGALLPGQLGIEVAVPQLPDWGLRPKKDVRKDVVIWRAPRMTCWAGPRQHGQAQHGESLMAVMEWKTLNNIGVPENAAAKRTEHRNDIDWLTRMSRRWPDVWGYAVFADLMTPEKSIACQRIRNGHAEPLSP